MSDDLLSEYLTRWKLRHPTKLASTATSSLYKVQMDGDVAVLKIFSKSGIKSESLGSESLSHFRGLGAVTLLNADNGAQLLSFIEGPTLRLMAEQGDDHSCAKIICQVLKILHSGIQPNSLPQGFPTMTENFQALFSCDRAFGQDKLLRRGADVARFLLKHEERKVVLHGDMHHGNVMHSSQNGWLAIDPKPLFGVLAYDTANSFYNPDFLNAGLIDIPRIRHYLEVFSLGLGISPKLILQYAFAYGCLSVCWDFEDGNDASMTIRIAKVIETLI